MTEAMAWSRQIYESSVSSRCWTYTPYDQGWEQCPELQHDESLRQLVEQERLLAPVPAWAQETVERCINYPPFCPQGAFPSPYLEVLDAIGRQAPPAFIHGCYTASPERKERMLDYVFCLDAWLAGAGPRQAAAELAGRSRTQIDWPSVCDAVWVVLGQRSELKELLIRRILHRQRWWVKSLVWDDDRRDIYCRDQYLGDVVCDGHGYGHYGNPEFQDPYFAEMEVPEVKALEDRLSQCCPDWPWFRSFILDSWLCGPKAFRFLERLLWCVGKERRAVSLPSHPLENVDEVPGYLQCGDTYWSAVDGKEWVRSFAQGIRDWRSGCDPVDPLGQDIAGRLRGRTPVKVWLAGLYLRKLEFLNPYGGMRSG